MGNKIFVKHYTSPKKEYTDDLMLVQDRIQEVFDQFTDDPVNDNALLENIELGTSTVLVQHLIGRAVRGWYIVDKDADARVWRDATSTADTTLFLALKASATVTVSIVVF